ncbi:zinc finger CCCH domain-containing protein 15 homolog isoform X2 [Bombus pyrosoma]|uniref:zinc finger CCCH domain-containing protein 15 homolog isoform X2 n=1 Tax=Bombus pyrosoma TaxID=396416 RepID=UPI001CB88BF0|nr:zinc finger CCCH domain-containing protein 15 homolog isoform X2 [Bombus pyrosoma]
MTTVMVMVVHDDDNDDDDDDDDDDGDDGDDDDGTHCGTHTMPLGNDNTLKVPREKSSNVILETNSAQ